MQSGSSGRRAHARGRAEHLPQVPILLCTLPLGSLISSQYRAEAGQRGRGRSAEYSALVAVGQRRCRAGKGMVAVVAAGQLLGSGQSGRAETWGAERQKQSGKRQSGWRAEALQGSKGEGRGAIGQRAAGQRGRG